MPSTPAGCALGDGSAKDLPQAKSVPKARPEGAGGARGPGTVHASR